MAKVTFRRGEASLYKERWQEYNINGNQEYAYLANAIYFATDTHELYLDGNNYTFESDVDFDNIITDVDFNADNNEIKIEYSDVDKPSKVIQLYQVALKNTDGALKLDIITDEEGRKIYQLDMKEISELGVKGVTSSFETNDIVENGDSFATAFSKINDSLGWVDVPDDDTEE